MILVLVLLGAAVGAPLRYATDRALQRRLDPVFPWGTFVVNVVGSFVLGLLVGLVSSSNSAARALVGVGLCGALTTYSTFSYETLRLAEDGSRRYALANITATVIVGLGAAFAGAGVARLC